MHGLLRQRPERIRLDPNRPYAFFVEDERSSSGEIVPVATIFLTNRECPWRCTMCDLWKNTLTEPVEPGAISRQIEYALDRLPPARQIKLYNSGSFFDAQAIPPAEYASIAALIAGFERTIVECHPGLVGSRCFEFRELLKQPLEVAMGLETAHPAVLEKLNKRMTVEQFARAADALRSRDIDLRVFLLVQPPFMPPHETMEWTQAIRSMLCTFRIAARQRQASSPTRGGQRRDGDAGTARRVRAPHARNHGSRDDLRIELSETSGRVFAGSYGICIAMRRSRCVQCWPARIERLQANQP